VSAYVASSPRNILKSAPQDSRAIRTKEKLAVVVNTRVKNLLSRPIETELVSYSNKIKDMSKTECTEN
jgi:hypothetical protein